MYVISIISESHLYPHLERIIGDIYLNLKDNSITRGNLMTSELIEHHTHYKEIDGYDETIWMTRSEHINLHKRLRAEGKCNISPEELHKISTAAHCRTDKARKQQQERREKDPDYIKKWKDKNPNYPNEWRQKNLEKRRKKEKGYRNSEKRKEYQRRYQKEYYKNKIKGEKDE